MLEFKLQSSIPVGQQHWNRINCYFIRAFILDISVKSVKLWKGSGVVHLGQVISPTVKTLEVNEWRYNQLSFECGRKERHVDTRYDHWVKEATRRSASLHLTPLDTSLCMSVCGAFLCCKPVSVFMSLCSVACSCLYTASYYTDCVSIFKERKIRGSFFFL